MSTIRTRGAVLGILLAIAVAFASGYVFATLRSSHPPVMVGSGYVGEAVATLFAGDAAYGFRSSVNWTDVNGSFHDGGWPDCLPRLQEVSGIRFAGEWQWVGDSATAEIVWVDCSTP